MNIWRVVALLAILSFLAALSYSLHLVSTQRDPLDVLKEELAEPSRAIEFIEKADPSFYMKLSIMGDMARRGDVEALRALITVAEFVWSGRDRDFLSYWLTEVSASQPELFLAVSSRMEEDAENTVEMVAEGIVHYGSREEDMEALKPLRQAAREMDGTSEWIRKEVKKACHIESRKEAEKDSGGSG